MCSAIALTTTVCAPKTGHCLLPCCHLYTPTVHMSCTTAQSTLCCSAHPTHHNTRLVRAHTATRVHSTAAEPTWAGPATAPCSTLAQILNSTPLISHKSLLTCLPTRGVVASHSYSKPASKSNKPHKRGTGSCPANAVCIASSETHSNGELPATRVWCTAGAQPPLSFGCLGRHNMRAACRTTADNPSHNKHQQA